MATMQMSVSAEDLSGLPKGGERIPDPAILVIFGASGDLTKRKLLPALFHLYEANLLPQQFAIVGVARRPLGDEFAADMRSGLVEFGGVDSSDPKIDSFVSRIGYFPLNFDDPTHYANLKTELDRIAQEKGIGPNRLHYLATAPEFFARDRRKSGRAGHGAAGKRPRRRGHREALRSRPQFRARAQPPGQRRLPGGPGLPHRPLPGQGDGAESARLPLRQRHL